MSCPDAETTTMLWVYGEGPEDHASHVAGCADCRSVVAEHEAVAGDIAGILPVIRRLDDEAAPEPANNDRGWVRWLVALGVASALLLVVGSQILTPSAVDESIDPPSAVAIAVQADAFTDGVVLAPFYADIDAELDDLDFLVASLAADSSIL